MFKNNYGIKYKRLLEINLNVVFEEEFKPIKRKEINFDICT